MTSVPLLSAMEPRRPSDPGGIGVSHLHEVEVGQHAHGPVGHLLRCRSQGGPLGRIGNRLLTAIGVQHQDLRPHRQTGENVAGPHAHDVGQGQSHDVGAALGSQVGRPELAGEDLLGSQAPEKIPIEGTVGGQGHVGHELHPVLGDGPDRGDELERGPFVVAHGGGQSHELLTSGTGGRNRVVVAVEVALTERGREPERAALHRFGYQFGHGSQLLGIRRSAAGRSSHDHPADRGVSHQKPGVDGKAPIDPVEVLSKRPPLPGSRSFERAQRNPFDHRHHPLDVLRIVAADGGDRESTVPSHHGRHAMNGRRAGGRVPQELCVVVGVDVDETGADHLAGDVDLFGAVLVDLPDGRHPAGSDTHVGQAARRSRSVDHKAAPQNPIEQLSPRSPRRLQPARLRSP